MPGKWELYCKTDADLKVIHPKYYKHLKNLLSTAIWADKNRLVSGRIACISSNNLRPGLKQYSNLVFFILNLCIQFRMYFHPKNLKSERYNP
jgi:hypothetical protein